MAVRKFARDDKALGVIGPFSSSEARVAFAAGEREKIVQIPNASSAPKLADKYSYAYRLTESEFLQFARVIKTMKKRGALKKSVAILYGTDDVVSKAVGLYIMKPILTKEKVKITGPIGFRDQSVRCLTAGFPASEANSSIMSVLPGLRRLLFAWSRR